MDNKHDQSKQIGRRQALRVIGAGVASFAGLTLFGGCKKEESAAKPAAAAGGGGGGSCESRVPFDEQAAMLRKTLQYKEKTENPEKKCLTCAQYEAGKYGDCGGCKLFGGAVSPEGACLSFAPKPPA